MTISEWRFTKEPLTEVYSKPKSDKTRKLIAKLLMGEWVKPLDIKGDETQVRYRGGIGYIPSASFGKKRVLEIYFIDVGQGDSMLVQTPSDKRILIDGGRDKRTNGFLNWKYNLSSNNIDFAAVIMTHADKDHAKGLNFVLRNAKIKIEKFYHNGIAKFTKGSVGKTEKKDGKNKKLVELFSSINDLQGKKLSKEFADLIDSLKRAGVRHSTLTSERLDDHSGKLVGFDSADDLQVTALGPINTGSSTKPAYHWFGTAAQTINGNSVALLLQYGKARILLCGDMNAKAEKKFLEKYENGKLHAHVFKANHHGSQDFTAEFLKAVTPWVSVVSSGDYPDYGHPRAVLLGSLGQHAPANLDRPLVFSTEVAATFKPIPRSKAKKISKTFLYEKSIHGMINIRTDGETVVAARVYGGKSLQLDGKKREVWNWECYKFDLTKPAKSEKCCP